MLAEKGLLKDAERNSRMQQGCIRISLLALLLLCLSAGYSHAQRTTPTIEGVLIETLKPYDNVVRAIEALGGRVTYQYAYVNGIAADIPSERFATIRSIPGVTALYKDGEIAKPSSLGSTRGGGSIPVSTETSEPVGRLSSKDLAKLALTSPSYSINNAGTNIERLHARGLTGQGTTVAVIDSGVRSGFKLVEDAIIGGIDFVDDGAPGPAADGQADWKQSSNDGHGTFVAGLIAGNYTFKVNRVMEQALLRYAPGALVQGNLPLIGTAPDAKIYVVRVFGEAGARVSTVVEAINHVIAQRELYFSSGGRQGIKIDVANLSLGISTLAAGRTLLDTSIDEMQEAGIVPVISVSDIGPSTLTNLSPATSKSALSVGASSVAVNERILYEVQYGIEFPKEFYPGIGADIRPFPGTEVQWFSSRGPSSDGRLDPDVVANGVGNLSQGYCPNEILEACFKRLSLGSGTSFSTPIVSGIAAVLTQAFPNATATQIRNAIISSAKTSALEPYFDVLDRGHGVPDADAAYALLSAGNVPDVLPPLPPMHTLVRNNIESNTSLIVQSGSIGKSFQNMMPGQRAEILYDVPLLTDYVRIRVSNVVMNGPQNRFYGGDRLFLYVHSARTSVGGTGDYRVNGELLLNGGQGEFIVRNPDTGVMRITLNPDTQNAGTVNAEVSVETALTVFDSTKTITGTIGNGLINSYTEHVNAGTTQLRFLLKWDHDWAHYPTSDLDIIVCSPTIPSTVADCRLLGNKSGATLASPERVTIENPIPGDWTFLIHGFNVPHGGTENFTLEIGH